MGWLHRLLHDSEQVLAQLAQIHFIAQRCTERLHGPGRIILATVETPVNDTLNSMTQRLEQGRDHQCGGDNDQGILLLVEKAAYQGTEAEHKASVNQGQDHGQAGIHKRATNEDINVPQAGAQNSNRNAQRYEQEKDKCERSISQLIGGVRRSQSGDQAADEIIEDTQHNQSREAKEQPLRLLALCETEDAHVAVDKHTNRSPIGQQPFDGRRGEEART